MSRRRPAKEPERFELKVAEVYQSLKNLNKSKLRIFYSIGKYGVDKVPFIVTNILKDIPKSTVYNYYGRYIRKGRIKVLGLPNVFKLGLKIVHVFFSKAPKILPAEDFVVFKTKLYSSEAELYTRYVVPYGREALLEEVIDIAKEYNIVDRYEFELSTLGYEVARGHTWFDFKTRKWKLDWAGFVEDVVKAPAEMPEVLKHYTYPKVKLDPIDLEIVKNKERKATVTMVEVARKLKKTPQALRYHYVRHVEKNELIYGNKMFYLHYPMRDKLGRRSEFGLFKISFTSEGNLAKFVNALDMKPFAHTVWRLEDGRTALVDVNVPCGDMAKFVDALRHLEANRVLRKFTYYPIDIDTAILRELPYGLYSFRNMDWTFDYQKYLETIEKASK